MFAPGLPYYFFAMFSMTSGKSVKTFPRYLAAALPSSDANDLVTSFHEIFAIHSEDGQSRKATVCSLSIGVLRMAMNWDADQLSVPGQTDPYAISLVKSCRGFFILNALFALADRWVTIIRFFLLMAQLTATRILGPSIPTQATGYGSSEGRMALPYHKDDPNTDYKLIGNLYLEGITPITYEYLMEIGGEIGKDARMATQHTFEDLMAANDEFRTDFWQG
ncbi:hypothetical protein BDR04DRAFT_1178824 [Suillus decipiens]|nr:hypothetical protein BDR04DRAFT_1178824 [Suillus decipiens]